MNNRIAYLAIIASSAMEQFGELLTRFSCSATIMKLPTTNNQFYFTQVELTHEEYLVFKLTFDHKVLELSKVNPVLDSIQDYAVDPEFMNDQ